MCLRMLTPLVLTSVGSLLAAGAIAQSCVLVTTPTCCDELGLNFTRRCGILLGQECPDEILSNPAFYKSTTVLNGVHPGTPAPSVLCQYKTGNCTGLFGNNLCEMSDVTEHECVSQPGCAIGCATATPPPH